MKSVLWLLAVVLFLPVVAVAQTNVQLVLTFKQGAMLSVDGKNKKLKVGETWSGVKLVSVDGAAAVVRVGDQQQVLQRGGGGVFAGTSSSPYQKQNTQLKVDANGLFFVNTQVNGTQSRFVVDTGANIVVLNSVLAERMGLEYKDAPKSRAKTASGEATVHLVTIAQMNVDGMEIRSVQAGVVEGGYPEVPLLGTSALNKFVMSRDGDIMQLTLR